MLVHPLRTNYLWTQFLNTKENLSIILQVSEISNNNNSKYITFSFLWVRAIAIFRKVLSVTA